MKLFVIAILLAAALPINGKKQRLEAIANQDPAYDGKSPAANASKSTVCKLEQAGTVIRCEWSDAPPQSYFKRLFSPEDAPNIGLVLVGIAGVCAAVATLNKIRVQSDEMRLQRIAMQDSLEAIKRQADLMKEQINLSLERERAKLRIELEPLNPVPLKDVSNCYRIIGTVSTYGLTEAFVDRSEIYASIGADGVNNPLPEWHLSMHLDPVLRASALPSEFSTIIMGADGPASDEEMGLVREGHGYVYCVGKIEFSTLGQKWILRMRRCFKLVWGLSTANGTDFLGDWEPDGMTWENQEIRHYPDPPIFRPDNPNQETT